MLKGKATSLVDPSSLADKSSWVQSELLMMALSSAFAAATNDWLTKIAAMIAATAARRDRLEPMTTPDCRCGWSQSIGPRSLIALPTCGGVRILRKTGKG